MVLLKQLDFSGDGKIDYREFLGIASEPVSWHSVFKGQRRNAAKVKDLARSIVMLAFNRACHEIDTRGSIWVDVRRELWSRRNRGQFIQRNISAVEDSAYCVRTSRSILVATCTM